MSDDQDQNPLNDADTSFNEFRATIKSDLVETDRQTELENPTGFFAGLTDEQKVKTLANTDDPSFGDDTYLDDLLYEPRKIIECACHDPFHHIVLDWDEDDKEVLIYIQMKHYLPFHKRVWKAIQYVFKLDAPRIDYVETVIRDKELEMISRFFKDAVEKSK